MKVKTVIEPAFEPITLADAKKHLRVDFADDDAYITSLITVARQYAENRTWRAICAATYDAFFDSYGTEYLLPRPLCTGVNIVQYRNTSGTYTTINANDYYADLEAIPAKVYLKLPKPQDFEPINGIKIRFTAGYANANIVPTSLKHAIRMIVSHFYENREPVVIGRTATLEPKELPFGIESLLDMSSLRRLY